RDARERGLDRERDLFLDLERRQRREQRVDLDLVVRDVGHGVDRQPAQRRDADRRRHEREHEDEPSVLDRETENGFEHRCAQSSAELLPSSAFKMKLPATTNGSPSASPARIGNIPPIAGPTRTDRRANACSSPATGTNTLGWPS